jgi:hypothetical protein
MVELELAMVASRLLKKTEPMGFDRCIEHLDFIRMTIYSIVQDPSVLCKMSKGLLV